MRWSVSIDFGRVGLIITSKLLIDILTNLGELLF